MQLGDNKALVYLFSADNSTVVRLLEMYAFLYASTANSIVDGDAFNDTDGNIRPFWDAVRDTWRAAGEKREITDLFGDPWLDGQYTYLYSHICPQLGLLQQ
jgi:hypothetical protein